MARPSGARTNGHRLPSNAPTNNGQPPPSTAAVQIVEQHETADGAGSNATSTFRQLLDEIRASPNAVEADPAGNHKLIRVVTEAGLHASNLKDPFARNEDAEQQIFACLEVIEIALRSTPEVLMKDAHLGSESGSLCWLLLSKLMALLGVEGVRDAIKRLLKTTMNIILRAPGCRKHGQLLARVLQCGAQDAFTLLVNRIESASKSASSELSCPSIAMLGILRPDAIASVAAPPGKRVILEGNDHLTHILIAMLEVFLSVDQIHQVLATSVGTVRKWISSRLSKVWNKAIQTTRNTSASAVSAQTLAALLNVIRTACVGCSRACYDSVNLFEILLKCTSDLMHTPSILRRPELSTSFAETSDVLLDTCRANDASWRKARYLLYDQVNTILSDPARLEVYEENFRNSLRMLGECLRHDLERSVRDLQTEPPLESVEGHSATNAGKSHENLSSIQDVHLDEQTHEERPSKRVRRQLMEPHGNSPTQPALKLLSDLFRGWDPSIVERATEIFADLDEVQQFRACHSLGQAFCDQAKSHRRSSRKHRTCMICKGGRLLVDSQPSGPLTHEFEKTTIDVLTSIISGPNMQASNPLRVAAMSATTRIASHTSQVNQLDLSASSLGKWVLQSLCSSSRELRIASSKALRAFLIGSECPNSQVLRRNCATALNFLRSLSQNDDSRMYETIVLAFGQVALVCSDDELHLVLLQFIDFLGSSNSLLSGLAYLEIQALAENRSQAIEELVKPYWSTIAIGVVKDMRRRPQKLQNIAELVGWSVNRFLEETQQYTLPYLVQWSQIEILDRLNESVSERSSVWDLCLRPNNLSAILALLLTQHPTNVEAVVAQCFKTINPDVNDESVRQLFKVDPAAVARDIVLVAGQADTEEKERALQGLKELALVVERRAHSTRGSTTQARTLSLFCDNHALGVVNYLSLRIENPSEHSVQKKRAILAIEEFIHMTKRDAVVALPQIRACLQSAFDDPELCNVAFSAWATVFNVADRDSLESIIQQTFTLAIQKWRFYDINTQQLAYDTVLAIFRNHGPLVQDNADVLPSLAGIPAMSKFESELSKYRPDSEVSENLASFCKRCNDENALIVLQALREMRVYLELHQRWIHDTAVSEQPLPIVANLLRTLLDTSSRFHNDSRGISELASDCLGVIGSVDPNRVESIKEVNVPLMHSNFKKAGEAVDFVAFFLENVLVKAFQSASNPRAQGFLAYVMQELLKFCGFNKEVLASYRPHGSQGDEIYQRWMQMPEAVRQVLTPFLNSHYVLKANTANPMLGKSYPVYSKSISHSTWLRDFVLDLLHTAKGDNAKMIFNVVARIIRGCELSIVSLLLPYAVANIILDGTRDEGLKISQELLVIIKQPTSPLTSPEVEHLKKCSEDVFQVLDYMSRLMQQKKRGVTANRLIVERAGRSLDSSELDQERNELQQISNIEAVLTQIPPDIISLRAAECGSFARAILHWEMHMRDSQRSEDGVSSSEKEVQLQQLQSMYRGIDEPDGIEGISAGLHVLDPEQQAIEHSKAGRWTAAQSWYLMRAQEAPEDIALQTKLLSCLKDASQYNAVLQHLDTVSSSVIKDTTIQSIASEAAWSAGNWEWLAHNLKSSPPRENVGFNPNIGTALIELRAKNSKSFLKLIKDSRHEIARSLSGSTISSIQTSRQHLFNLHALYEVELLSGVRKSSIGSDALTRILDRRLDVLGSSIADKQYLLSLRRAVTEAVNGGDRYNLASSWMTSAKLARKNPTKALAYDAVNHAAKLGDESSRIEHARLLWSEGEHRRAIKSLEGAMGSEFFGATSEGPAQAEAPAAATSTTASFTTTNTNDPQAQHSMLVARAHLLMAKWLDRAGQSQSLTVLEKYRQVTFTFQKWEKGLFYLAKFYNKIHDSERAQPTSRHSFRYLSGETSKLVIENYLRALMFGCKYINQSLPKLLTLWLDFGLEVDRAISKEVPNDIREKANGVRGKFIKDINKQVNKYSEKIPSFVFYTALPQMITRISHQNSTVWDVLALLIIKVVVAHPQQALWSLLATVKASERERANRGVQLLNRLKQANSKTVRNEGTSVDLRALVQSGQRLSDELLRACEAPVHGRTTHVSLQKDLNFKMKVAPCPLVIPLEKTLTASLPTTNNSREMRAHKAFPITREAITVSAFEDSVLVLSSLQKPRKLTVRGSDGQKYGLLCKPNDDLRKDQRLMEFNAMINKALKKDTGASARRLYVKTYAVTPLNESCGLIEWVEGLKPMRDILIALYRSRGIKIDYNLLRQMLAEACQKPPETTGIFSNQLLEMYYPILHEWFTENFPAPDAWYAARTRYARSCATTSIVGYALGLGDRHGENVLLEEKSGGVFHVDFNCLFDKGLTFEKPELVPFRLTHNMVDAMGPTGVEGSYRRAAEATLSVMREQEDALLTILETFVYDPTADFVGNRQRTSRTINIAGISHGIGRNQTIPETPREVLESVRSKLKGMLPGESLPVNVQGYVEALIAMATDPQRLARMYIGWCAFL